MTSTCYANTARQSVPSCDSTVTHQALPRLRQGRAARAICELVADRRSRGQGLTRRHSTMLPGTKGAWSGVYAGYQLMGRREVPVERGRREELPAPAG